MRDKNLKSDETEDENTFQFLVTVDQAEEDEEALIESLRSEIKFLVDDEREGAKEYLKSFGEVSSDSKGKEVVKDDEETELQPHSGKRGKRGAASAAASASASGSSTRGKKQQKTAIGPIIDPRKLKKDTESAPHMFDLALKSQCASVDFLQ